MSNRSSHSSTLAISLDLIPYDVCLYPFGKIPHDVAIRYHVVAGQKDPRYEIQVDSATEIVDDTLLEEVHWKCNRDIIPSIVSEIHCHAQ